MDILSSCTSNDQCSGLYTCKSINGANICYCADNRYWNDTSCGKAIYFVFCTKD